MKWFDNKPVHITANHGTAEILNKVRRWNGQAKKHVLVDCPDTVKRYNSAMGGVDFADMLISLYRTPYKTRRWYLRVVVHLLDVCKVNAWILYWRFANQLKIPARRKMMLAEFTSKIVHTLIYRGKPIDRPIGRPKKRILEDRNEKRGKMSKIPAPPDDVCFDEVWHCPQSVAKKRNCRECKVTSQIKCMKCSCLHGAENGSVYLCLEQDWNCFYSYHSPA